MRWKRWSANTSVDDAANGDEIGRKDRDTTEGINGVQSHGGA